MEKLDTSHINALVTKRLLHLLNQTFQAEQIQDMNPLPDDAKEYWIGPVVAQRIIDHRKTLPFRRYRDLSQLNGVEGFGQEKLDDLAQLLEQAAAQQFLERLQNKVLPGNFTLEYQQIRFELEEVFQDVVSNPYSLKTHIADSIEKVMFKKTNNFQLSKLGAELLHQSYVDTIEPDYLGAYAFANWFYAFDADNWFSYTQIQQECSRYLDGEVYHADRRQLIVFRGFHNGLTLATEGITPDNLPVVLNYDEKVITIWWGQLFD